MINNTVADS